MTFLQCLFNGGTQPSNTKFLYCDMTLFQRLFNEGQKHIRKFWLDFGCIMVVTLFPTKQPKRNVVYSSCARWDYIGYIDIYSPQCVYLYVF